MRELPLESILIWLKDLETGPGCSLNGNVYSPPIDLYAS